jgi:CRP-like cAMP-binding protein
VSHGTNKLLASMAPDDLRLIEPHLRSIKLEQHTVLYNAGDAVDRVYFPFDAVISLVAVLSTGVMVEAAMVGRDGVVGALAAVDGKMSFTRAIVQIGGNGSFCDVDRLRAIATTHPSILGLLMRHEQTVYAQAQQSAACMAAHNVEARLARWMLRARDLSGSDTLNFTQEFLAEMLGVQRPSVSVTAHTLQQAGVITYSRGRIKITNVEGLKECACECYGTIQAQYEQLFGPIGG